MNKPAAMLALFAFAALAFSACREQETTSAGFIPRERTEAGEPRAYQLGFSALPAALPSSPGGHCTQLRAMNRSPAACWSSVP